jgi:hypothetical protein
MQFLKGEERGKDPKDSVGFTLAALSPEGEGAAGSSDSMDGVGAVSVFDPCGRWSCYVKATFSGESALPRIIYTLGRQAQSAEVSGY